MRTRMRLTVAAVVVPLTLSATAGASAKAKKPAKPTRCSTVSAFTSSKQKLVKNNPEIAKIQGLLPYVDRWQKAIAKKNQAASLQAAEDYEAYWQGIEVYVNDRSLVLYTDTETDTQFPLDALLAQPVVSWSQACGLVKHIGKDIDAAIALSTAGPKVDPIFDDLAKVRRLRAQLNIARTALTAGDEAKAERFIGIFTAGLPGTEGLIAARGQREVDDIHASYAPLAAAMADPAKTAASVNVPFLVFQARVGQGVNLINAAARASDHHRTGITDNDKTNLTNLNNVLVALNNSVSQVGVDKAAAAKGGDTGPSSAFAKVEPALEVQARYISVAPALRNALNAYAKLVNVDTAPAQDKVTAAVNAVKDQIDIDRQDLVGQFWGDAGLQAFLATLPTS